MWVERLSELLAKPAICQPDFKSGSIVMSKALPEVFGDKIAAEINAKVAIDDNPTDRLELARWMALTLTTAVAEDGESTRH